MSILIRIFGSAERVKTFTEYFKRNGDIEVGDFHKHSDCFATKRISIDSYDLVDFPELKPYADGYVFEQEGLQNYSWGFEASDEIRLFQIVEKETKAVSDFNALLGHLNSEDNEMAIKFRKEHLPAVTVSQVEVTE